MCLVILPMFRNTHSSRAGLVLRDLGLTFLYRRDLPVHEDYVNALLNGPDDLVPSLIEAGLRALDSRVFVSYPRSGFFRDPLVTILREHRISFELVEDEMVPFASRELHSEVVGPVLRLLSGRADWDKVEAVYPGGAVRVVGRQAGQCNH